jgi:hypothetical protein
MHFDNQKLSKHLVMPVYRTTIDDNRLWYINEIFLVDIELQAKVITRT